MKFYRQVTVSGFPAVALRAGEVEAVVVPSIGMKVTNLRRIRGREWLWRSDQIPLAPPVPGTSYVERADSGGWDECFPTVGPSPLPGAPPGTPELPDHGELWSAGWTSSILERDGRVTLASTALGTLLPYEFYREVTLHADEPVVRFTYRLRHLGDALFPWIWSPHPLFNVQPGTTLELPGVRQVRVDAVHGRDDLKRDDCVGWPLQDPSTGGAGGGDGSRFTMPADGGWAVKIFGDIGPGGRMVLTDPRLGERLELAVDPARVPQVGIWINSRGWAPAGREPYFNLALEPCVGAPDRLDDAVLRWQTAQTLAPGEVREWAVDAWLLEAGEPSAG
jgi:galactose mutarotase-like enzyme